MQSLNQDAVQYLMQKGVPTTTANLNRAMNILADNDSLRQNLGNVSEGDTTPMPDSGTGQDPTGQPNQQASAGGSGSSGSNPIAQAIQKQLSPQNYTGGSEASVDPGSRDVGSRPESYDPTTQDRLDQGVAQNSPDGDGDEGSFPGMTPGQAAGGAAAGVGLGELLHRLIGRTSGSEALGGNPIPPNGPPGAGQGAGTTIEGSLPATMPHGNEPVPANEGGGLMEELLRILGRGAKR